MTERMSSKVRLRSHSESSSECESNNPSNGSEDDSRSKKANVASESEDDVQITPKKKFKKTVRSKYTKYYNKEWEKERRWLQPSIKGRTYFHCVPCGKDGIAALYNVTRHAQSKKHIKIQESIASSKKDLFKSTGTLMNTAQKKLKILDIRLCFYLIEHNHSALSVDHLVSLFKTSFKLLNPLNDAANKFCCGRTKTTAIIQNVIGKAGESAVLQKIRVTDFALMIDESTDIASDQHLALVIRTVDESEQSSYVVHDEFLALLPVNDRTAKGLHGDIVKYFKENDVPYESRMKAFGSDNANVMQGCTESVAALFKENIPHLVVIRCLCHWLAIASSYAGGFILGEVNDLLTRITMYFKNSGKRLQAFEAVLEELNMDILKLLQRSNTRWLSLSACMRRILELLPGLKEYFSKEYNGLREKFKLTMAETNLKSELKYILDLLHNPLTEMYIGFLSYILPMICNVNLEFQAENPRIFDIHGKIYQLRRTLMSNYKRPAYVNDKTVNQRTGHNNPNYYSPDSETFAGPFVTAFLETHEVPQSTLKEFFTAVRNFYVAFLDKMFERFPIDDGLLKHISMLKPTNLKTLRTLSNLAAYIPQCVGLDLFQLDTELQLIQNDQNLDFGTNILEFYKSVADTKLGSGQPAYKNVTKMIKFLLVLPHSTATVERIFSAVNINKTKQRNKMKRKTLEGILHGKNILKISKSNCFQIEVPDTMLNLHNNTMYGSKTEDTFESDDALFCNPC